MNNILPQRFWEKIKYVENGCWLWTASKSVGGYGQFRLNHITVKAHLLAYESLIGPIPKGLTLDHLCHNLDKDNCYRKECLHRSCVNPAHLEPVTLKENISRGNAGRHLKEKTHCLRGHKFTPENTNTNGGRGRGCKRCMADRMIDRRLKKKFSVYEILNAGKP